MASRSVDINFVNKTDFALVLAGTDLPHGEWTTEPPARIEAGATVAWASESDGVATGTEGTAFYNIEGTTGQTSWHWDNPFIGSNSYDESTPETFKGSHSGGDGDNATITYTFDDASLTGDGIPDDWKRNGVTIDPGDGSGPQFIDLPAMGADVNKPDIFIQVDWMANATHSHALPPAVIKTVVDAFANSPFISRSGSIGINLHVDAGPNSIMNFATGQTWGALSRARQLGEVPQLGTGTVDSAGNVSNYAWKEFDEIKNQPGGFTSSGRTKIFRYCIAAHQLATASNSGISRDVPGSDFIISLGTFTGIVDVNIAGTFMHELGHCLGLDHGGGDATNFKPNYVSVMNYAWQFTGVTRGGTAGIVDYSNAELRSLNEASLDETQGLGPAASGVAIQHWVPGVPPAPGAFVPVADGSQPIDWDGDGVATNTKLAFDINNDAIQTTLAPFNDWKILKLRGGSIGSAGTYVPPSHSSHVDITPLELKRILPADTVPPVTIASLWPKPNAAGWNRTAVEVTLTATDDISGVARTEYDLDGAGFARATAPITIAGEGNHGFDYRSIDRSQNVEPARHLDVRIDMTAPECVISYDPAGDDIVVTGRDALSGVSSKPAVPHAVPTTWTDFGSDVAELRTYRLADRADNVTTLLLKVRCSPQRYEASVLRIRYEDEAHARRSEPPGRSTQDDRQPPRRPGDADDRQGRAERNTLIFERLVGRSHHRPLLGVKQIVSLGEGVSRRTVHARYDVLDDLTLMSHESGSTPCCEQDRAIPAFSADRRGLLILHVVTRDGHLVVEE